MQAVTKVARGIAGLGIVIVSLVFLIEVFGDPKPVSVSQPEQAAAPAAVAEKPKPNPEELARAKAERAGAALCRRLFKNAATHPSTVDFPWMDEYHDLKTVNGVVHFRGSASTRNTFNLELTYVIDCRVKDGKIVSFNVMEAR